MELTPLKNERDNDRHLAEIPRPSPLPKKPIPDQLTGLSDDGNGSDSIAPGNGNPGNKADSNTCNGMGTCNNIRARGATVVVATATMPIIAGRVSVAVMITYSKCKREMS